MQSSYYSQQQIFIPRVDENDTYIDVIERWQAHEKGILHRAFSVALYHEGKILCQHRRHPVFDKWFDVTASSHPQVSTDGVIQSCEEAAVSCLEREWGLELGELKNLRTAGSVMYRSPDPYSQYIEHEYCYLIKADIGVLPARNPEVAYGYTLLTPQELSSEDSPFYPALATWVKEFIRTGLL